MLACHFCYSYRNINTAAKNKHVRHRFWYQFCWCWCVFKKNEALSLVPLALVESSLVRCTSFSFNFFLSGFFLWSSTTSGSICREEALNESSVCFTFAEVNHQIKLLLTRWKYFPEKFSSSEGKIRTEINRDH